MKKRVEDSWTEQVHTVMSGDINGYGRLFGGRLLEWIDEVAGIVGRRHAGMTSITAAIDHLQFKAGAYMGDMIVLIGRVVCVGRSSMEVRVDSYREDNNGMRYPINRAYLTMVALDEEEHSTQVPELIIEGAAQTAEWEYAIKRKEARKKRQREGFV